MSTLRPKASTSQRLQNVAARLASEAAETLYPTRCVACDLPGELLCVNCRSELPWVNQIYACPNCGAAFGNLTCTQCSSEEPWETRALIAAMSNTRATMRIVTVFKDEHELRLAPLIAAAIATALDEASGLPAQDGAPRIDAQALHGICFVPATASAYERRGFDHMELVARALARQLGLPLTDVLARHETADQRSLGRAGRQSNLAGSIEVLDDVSGLDLLLVDDIVTTGATLRTCAKALLARGAASVTAACLARVW